MLSRSGRRRSAPFRANHQKNKTKASPYLPSCITFFKTLTRAPQILVEALTGDFAGSLERVSLVANSGLDVYAHNVETVEALTPYVRDRRATFRQSLKVLEHAKKEGVRITKTSVMLGVGETSDQLVSTLEGY